MKTLMKFILVFLALSILWHISPFSGGHISYHGDAEGLEWLVANALVVGAVFFAIALVLVVFISIFSAVVFFAGLVCITMLFVGVSFFWPLVLASLVLYWIFSEPKQVAYEK